jgi:hypothetical protein
VSDPDPLTVGLIRAFERVAAMTDHECIDLYGDSAQPLADGLRAAIREEVARQRDMEGR